jgi:undecaprenyl diphosphate synthase
MELFLTSLRNEVDELHRNSVRLKFIGNREGFPDKLGDMIRTTEDKTVSNTGLNLIIAANYGGRWDITNACRKIAFLVSRNELKSEDVNEELITGYLSLAGLPEPDLFIRTGGEQRISNYLLWQCAYSELYFSDVLWPDFSEADFDASIMWFEGRQRRFGRTTEQIREK